MLGVSVRLRAYVLRVLGTWAQRLCRVGIDRLPGAARIYRSVTGFIRSRGSTGHNPVDHVCLADWPTPLEVSSEAPEYSDGRASGWNSLPRLAVVSPFPPEESGIAYFTARLCEAMSQDYQLLVISDDSRHNIAQPENRPTAVRSTAWFEQHWREFDHIIYMLGNSEFHLSQLRLLWKIPGIVMAHEVVLDHLAFCLLSRPDTRRQLEQAMAESLRPQEYWALRNSDWRQLGALLLPKIIGSRATGIFVLTGYAEVLLAKAMPQSPVPIRQISFPAPSPREPAVTGASPNVGSQVHPEAVVVGAFGYVNESKLPHELVSAWAMTEGARQGHTVLVFVGSVEKKLRKKLLALCKSARIEPVFTGWVSDEEYKTWLNRIDIAVQLRSSNRGEASAAVFDLLSAGKAVILTAQGSFRELPKNAVHFVADNATPREIAAAIDELVIDSHKRRSLGQAATDFVQHSHLIGDTVSDITAGLAEFGTGGAPLNGPKVTPSNQKGLGTTHSGRPAKQVRRLLVDVTISVSSRRTTGIERVVSQLVVALISIAPDWLSVTPVTLCQAGPEPHFHLADNFYDRRPESEDVGPSPEPPPVIPLGPHDTLLLLDYHPTALEVLQSTGLIERWQRQGSTIWGLVYDLLPLSHSEFFPEHVTASHRQWVDNLHRLDGLLSISHWVQECLTDYLTALPLPDPDPLPRMGTIALGGDFPIGFRQRSRRPRSGKPIVLMVGTIEPRKNYELALDTFDILWARGEDIELHIVGREGWRDQSPNDRRPIIRVIDRIRELSRQGRPLHWHSSASDDELETLYVNSTLLLSTSHGEGFGLPIAEALNRGVPALLPDLPVFREVATAGAAFFISTEPEQLVEEILALLGKIPNLSQDLNTNWHPITWEQSGVSLLRHLFPAESGDGARNR